MANSMDALEQRIDDLRAEVRRSAMAGDRARANRLRSELRKVEAEWDATLTALAGPEPLEDATMAPTAPLLPVREQVHQALTFLTVPAAPKLIVALHNALFGGTLASGQLTSLRRDEERSFKTNRHGRPYYICAALTADRLSPARGLLAVSTWPMEARVVGPLSPRVHFLTAAIRVAEHLRQPEWATLPARRLLWEFAANIPGGARTFESMTPDAVQHAARTELETHEDADRSHREAAARRLIKLDDLQQMFGTTLGLAPATMGEG
ncbi:hypothetical protein AB0C22_30715 [Micromonospora sp. NPDC048894]|uniref:hypothetical protein n=1 Tax=Micromonospora sp. NPDC048894 TaxID=3155493 RepID=UPI0033D38546